MSCLKIAFHPADAASCSVNGFHCFVLAPGPVSAGATGSVAQLWQPEERWSQPQNAAGHEAA